jgi:hypothetical protein
MTSLTMMTTFFSVVNISTASFVINIICYELFVSFNSYSIISLIVEDIRATEECNRAAESHGQTSYHIIVRLYRIHFALDKILITS